MARLAIRMPKMSMTMTEGEVAQLQVSVGDQIEVGTLADVDDAFEHRPSFPERDLSTFLDLTATALGRSVTPDLTMYMWCGSGSVWRMGPEWIVVLVVVVLLFGSSQLPKLARSLGQAQKEFKTGMDEGAKTDLLKTDSTDDTETKA